MSRSLGVGLFRRPLWRRETDDSRSRMLATLTFGYIAARRMVWPGPAFGYWQVTADLLHGLSASADLCKCRCCECAGTRS